MKSHYSKVSILEKERKDGPRDAENKREAGIVLCRIGGKRRKGENEKEKVETERLARRMEKQIKKQKSSEVKECSTLEFRSRGLWHLLNQRPDEIERKKENSVATNLIGAFYAFHVSRDC